MLVKALYGLKQAPRVWHSKFIGVLPTLGFVASPSDTSLFVKHDGMNVSILLLYVYDIILTGSNASQVQSIIYIIGELFDLKDMAR